MVGTKPEYLNAVWVKNEWSRYLALMRTDRSRLLIPCYRDMDPYDMPEELSMLQSQDMGKIGFIQDLIRGVKKVVDAAKPQETAAETVKETVVVHNEGGSNVQALLKRGSMALEDGEWSKADEFFEQVLNQDAECGAAYLGKFLAKEKFPSTQKYAASYAAQVKSAAPKGKNAEACAEDKAFIEACIQKYQVADYYPAQEIRKALQFDRRYCADRAAYFRNSQKRAEQMLDTDRNFARAEKYASGETKVQCDALRSALADALRQQEQTAAQEAQAEKQRVIDDYQAFLKETEAKLAAKHEEALAKRAEDQRNADELERLRMERKKRAEEKQKRDELAAAARKKKITIAAGIIAAVILVATKVIIPAANYSKAEKLLAAGDYDGAIAAFAASDGYKDAENAKAHAHAELQKNGETAKAAIAFGKLGDYRDSSERSQVLWDVVAVRDTVSAGWIHTVGLKSDGTVVAAGYNKYGQCDVSGWTDIVAVSAGSDHTVGLKADGTVVAVGYEYCIQGLDRWTDIVAVSAGDYHTVGLKSDGTVVAKGSDNDGECDVGGWTDIVAVSAGWNHTVGLKSDGTVVAVGYNKYGQCDVSGWTDIVAVSAGGGYTVGLKRDGTVVAVGDNEGGKRDVSSWTDIVAISAGNDYTVGVKTDGTVVAVGYEYYIQGLDRWTDIKLPSDR